MKQKEIIQLLVAVVILAVAGTIIYSFFFPNKGSASKTVTYTKVTPINTDFSQEALSQLTNSSKSRDFYNAPDLKSGLGNTAPFGPLR